MSATHATREAWLVAFTEAARPTFLAASAPLPERIRMSMGFPFGARKAIGQCWGSTSSADGTFEIFIHPGHVNAVKAADTLTHELCHAADGLEHGHKAPFKRIALAVGLRGKMTGASGENVPEWHAWADPILAQLGPFPHAELDAALAKRKPQTTRMLKAECDACKLVFRVSARWAVRCIRCPDDECGGFVAVEGAGEEESED